MSQSGLVQLSMTAKAYRQLCTPFIFRKVFVRIDKLGTFVRSFARKGPYCSIVDLTFVKSLVLKSTHETPKVDAESFSSNFRHLTRLTELELFNIALSAQVLQLICQCSDLQTLMLDSCTLPVHLNGMREDLEYSSSGVYRELVGLQTLSIILSRNFEPITFRQFARLCPNVTELDISGENSLFTLDSVKHPKPVLTNLKTIRADVSFIPHIMKNRKITTVHVVIDDPIVDDFVLELSESGQSVENIIMDVEINQAEQAHKVLQIYPNLIKEFKIRGDNSGVRRAPCFRNVN